MNKARSCSTSVKKAWHYEPGAGGVASQGAPKRREREGLQHGDYDFAASRAYYAMFYVAEVLLLSKGLRFSSHSGVHAGFGEHFAKTGLIDTRFHRYLLDAGDIRTKGDYRIDFDISEVEAAEQIARAEELLVAGEQFLT